MFVQKWEQFQNIFLYTLVSKKQPNGNTVENCLTTFKLNNEGEPLWFDRPCIENDVIGVPGHKFMCEFNLPDRQNDLFSKIFLKFIINYFYLSIIK